jgi:protein-L-isoaspartate(D-aspartate) O-methyltransferase
MDKRQKMVETIKKIYGLSSPRVLSVMLKIPREMFAPKIHRLSAYNDGPVPIGFGQTMSQPYTVAFMTHLLIEGMQKNSPPSHKTMEGKKVLEIGTGSGYQAAILSKLVGEVYTIEIIGQLAEKAKVRLKKLGYKNVFVKVGSGEWGWPEKAPFDAIIITAGVNEKVPEALMAQLKTGGALVAPVGEGYEKVMVRYTKLKNGKTEKLKKETFGIFHFVPFVEEKN